MLFLEHLVRRLWGWRPSVFFLKKLFKFQEKTLGGFSMLFLIHARRKPLGGHLNPNVFFKNVFFGSFQGKAFGGHLIHFLPHPRRRPLGGHLICFQLNFNFNYFFGGSRKNIA